MIGTCYAERRLDTGGRVLFARTFPAEYYRYPACTTVAYNMRFLERVFRMLPVAFPPARCIASVVDYDDLFPAAAYEFRMGIRRGEPSAFFGAGPERETILAERQRWLYENSGAYVGVMPGGERLLKELIALCREWNAISAEEHAQILACEPDPLRRLQKLGARLEPDVLMLAPGRLGQMELLAGAVCFPSAWRLSEKLGGPMAMIHEPAPGLNRSLGSQIDVFLSRLRPGMTWLRSNWGLSASPELNQHPDRNLPRLGPQVELTQVWLRVERQALVRLPISGGVLFGIRIETELLEDTKRKSPEAANGLVHALRTMPQEIAVYKGIVNARDSLIARLLE